VSNIPSLRLREARFRSGTSSANQNDMQEEILYDVNHLYNLVNEQAALLQNTRTLVVTENKYQSKRIEDLLAELQKTQDLVRQLQLGDGKYTKRIYVDQMHADETATPQERAERDTYHRVLHLPIAGAMQSKVHLYDDIAKETVIPSTFVVKMEPEADGISVIDSNPLHAFDGDNANIWYRKCVFDADEYVDKVTVQVTMTLPDNIISSRNINTILVHPFPLSTMDIDKIEYRLEGNWTLIPGWPKDASDNPLPIQNAGNMKFCFESLPMAEVRVTLTQRNYILEDNKKVFYLGAQEIGVFYTNYQSSVGRFMVPALLEGNASTMLITRITPHFINEEALSDKTEEKRTVFAYDVYAVDERGVKSYTRDKLPIMVTTPNIVIKANINADPKTGATPVLDYVEVAYEDLL
jgi:hypothetical protein